MINNTKKKKIRIAVIVIVLVLALLFGGSAIYLADFYSADTAAIESFSARFEVAETELADGTLVFGSGDEEYGFIFYPGGKVEHTAYAPLAKALASKGIFCAVVKVPFKLAIMDTNAADGLQQLYPEIEHWYIGGHSLGGSAAGMYLEKHHDEYEGLILVASYSTADLSATELDVLSVYGDCDKVLNIENYAENNANLPEYTEIIIAGGCHAGFAMYGPQDGDGEPAISAEEQILQAVGHISEFIMR